MLGVIMVSGAMVNVILLNTVKVNIILPSDNLLNVVMQSILKLYHCAECRDGKCHSAVCRYVQ